MPLRNTLAALLVASLAGLALAVPAAAQERRSAGDQALKRAQYMLRQLTRDNQELESKLARLEDEKASLEAEAEGLSAELDATEARLDGSREQIGELVARIRSDVEKYQELRARYLETARELQQANRDNAFLVQAVQEREEWVGRCQERNADLLAAGQEILDRFKTLALGETEGIFGFERVRLENEVQRLRFRLEDLQVTQFVPARDILPFIRAQDAGTEASDEPG